MRLLQDAEPRDAIIIEQVDRLSHLDDKGWESLKKVIHEKSLSIISLDLPTNHIALSRSSTDDFSRSMLRAVNNMLLDILAAIARKDYEDRRSRQMEEITTAREKGKYRGRLADKEKHELIRTLRKKNGKSINETARLAGVSRMTVIRACKDTD